MIPRLPIPFLALGAALLATAASAAPQLVNNCQTLSQPGSYVVNRNLSANGDCLVVAADFVTIELDGFVLTGNGTGAGIAQQGAMPRRGLTVRNGVITGFLVAVDVPNVSGATVERVNATGNASHGIVVGDMATVAGSRAIANGGDGIRAGQRALVSGNNSEENAFNGIRVDLGGNVIGNTVGRNQINGISTSEGAAVVNNVSRNNQRHGILMDCPGLLLGNATSNNVTGDNFHDLGAGCVVNAHNSTL